MTGAFLWPACFGKAHGRGWKRDGVAAFTADALAENVCPELSGIFPHLLKWSLILVLFNFYLRPRALGSD